MDYKRIHDLIIERAKSRKLKGYGEKHHIIPKCLGGGNDKNNIVKLTAKEHFIVHKLLCEIYPDNTSLLRAFWLMANKVSNDNQARMYKISSREYNKIREEFSKINSEAKLGNIYWVGRNHSEETKKKLSNKKVSKETRRKMSEAAKARGPHPANYKPKPKEVRRKLSLNSSNSKKVIHLETGKIYYSMMEASRECNIAQRNIQNHCKGLVKKQKFKWVDEE